MRILILLNCEGNTTIGSGSCLGTNACENVGGNTTIGISSCSGNKACAGSFGTFLCFGYQLAMYLAN